ncbi:hypothetical protein NPIL_243551 [Nephila pilipes]|uniref:Uncharacterized protein n=1 Tax=Nephila pilipes TaxID=299642 RepID=A0A8X6U782_NEPPI|nr:hypothetical protein NPIL_243551 [Nephila pilipes]
MAVGYGWVPYVVEYVSNKADTHLAGGNNHCMGGVACLTISEVRLRPFRVMAHSRTWNSCGFFDVIWSRNEESFGQKTRRE